MTLGELFSGSITCLILLYSGAKCLPSARQEPTQKQRAMFRLVIRIINVFLLLASAITHLPWMQIVFYIVLVLSAVLIVLQEFQLRRSGRSDSGG